MLSPFVKNFSRHFRFQTLKFLSVDLDYKQAKMSASCNKKPPNLLIYTNNQQENKFKNVSDNLLHCLHPDSYVVYKLTRSEVDKIPWMDNVKLLIVAGDNIQEQVSHSFTNYVAKGGQLLIFCSKISIAGIVCEESEKRHSLIKMRYKNFDEIPALKGEFTYKIPENAEVLCRDIEGNSIITKLSFGQGVIVVVEVNMEIDPAILCSDPSEFSTLKQVDAERLVILKDILTSELGLDGATFSIPKLTPGYIIYEDTSFFEKFKNVVAKKTSFKFPIMEEITEPNRTTLPIYPNQNSPFQKDIYYSHLKTKILGKLVLFIPVVTTTMSISENLPELNELVVIASRQTDGHGRRGNKWISPEGCAMFTAHFKVSLNSHLGQRLSLLQHIASLAIVHGIKSIPGYEKLDIELKWPNDIYYRGQFKLGGVMATTSVQGRNADIYVGCGINVNNNRPTICINDVIKIYNSSTGESLSALSIEEIIARSLNVLEGLVNNFGDNNFLDLYYSYWMHENKTVKICVLNQQAKIKGIDEFGFLVVKTEDGQQHILQPDGNQFDIMQNLITMKSV